MQHTSFDTALKNEQTFLPLSSLLFWGFSLLLSLGEPRDNILFIFDVKLFCLETGRDVDIAMVMAFLSSQVAKLANYSIIQDVFDSLSKCLRVTC